MTIDTFQLLNFWHIYNLRTIVHNGMSKNDCRSKCDFDYGHVLLKTLKQMRISLLINDTPDNRNRLEIIQFFTYRGIILYFSFQNFLF